MKPMIIIFKRGITLDYMPRNGKLQDKNINTNLDPYPECCLIVFMFTT